MKCGQVGCRHVKFRVVDEKEGEFEFEIAKHFTFYTIYNIMWLC